MHGIRRDGSQGRRDQLRRRTLELHFRAAAGEEQELEQLRMPVWPNCPIIAQAARRDGFDMQESRLDDAVSITVEVEGRYETQRELPVSLQSQGSPSAL